MFVLTAATALVARPALPRVQTPLQLTRHEPPRALLSADAACGATGWAVLGLYHAVRLGGLGKHGVKEASWGETKGGSRAVWTRSILETENYILGVQTLRNALTSASFFSSSCFTLLSVIIGLASQRIASMSTLALIKYSCACCLLACSAFSYLQSVRYLNTCGFLFQCATDKRDASYSPANVMLLMVLANNAWSLGERSLYLLAPAVIWLVAGGPVMLASLGFLLPVLYFYDLPAPVDLDPDSDDLKPYAYLKSAGPLDFFGFQTAVKTARREALLYEGK